MTNYVPECYGAHGSGDCASCEWQEWCKDAADPPITDMRYEFCTEDEAAAMGLSYLAPVAEGSDLCKLLGELIYELDTEQADNLWEFLSLMSALSKDHPGMYRVVRMKILHPLETYESLGEMLGCTRQMVEMHLSSAVEYIPELKSAFMSPRSKLKRNKVESVKLRCSGGNILILVNGVVVLRMPHNETNAKHAPRVVTVLNNMHWKRLDAFIKEVVDG